MVTYSRLELESLDARELLGVAGVFERVAYVRTAHVAVVGRQLEPSRLRLSHLLRVGDATEEKVLDAVGCNALLARLERDGADVGGAVGRDGVFELKPDLALHGCFAARARVMVEQRFDRFPFDHLVGNGVGLVLVLIVGLTDAAADPHAGALLDHVRGFMGDGVQRWRLGKSDMLARRKRHGTHVLRCFDRFRIGVRLDAPHIMPTKSALEDGEIRQLTGPA